MLRQHLLGTWAMFVMVGVLAQACVGRTDALMASLPPSAGGVNFDVVRVIDESYSGQDPADDVLSLLGEGRGDASIVYRWASVDGAGIGALAVNEVRGPDLLNAVVQAWQAAAVTSRTKINLSGRDVWLLEIRPNHLAAAYVRGDAVYLVEADDRSLIERVLPSMP